MDGTCHSSGPTTFAHKRVRAARLLRDGRARPVARSVARSTSGIASDEDNLRHQFGKIADLVRPGVLTGSDEEILDSIGQYVEAGADQVNISLRAPFDMGLLERVSAALHLA